MPAYQLRNIREGFADAYIAARDMGVTLADLAIISARFELVCWHLGRALMAEVQ